MKKNASVSIIILDYQKADRVVRNIESLKKQVFKGERDIHILDNSVEKQNAKILKDLVKEQPQVNLTIHTRNYGYTQGNNRGAQKAGGDFLLFVNPDIVWKDAHALQKMVDYLEAHSSVGIVGPHQVNEGDQSDALTVRRFPHIFVQMARRTFLRHFPLIKKCVQRDEVSDFDYGKTQDVDWIQSSCLLIRRSLWEEIGGFDERYFLFLADTELCWQAWKHQKKVVYLAEATVMADGIRCSEGSLWDLFKNHILRWHVRDAWKYFWRHWGRVNPRKKFIEKTEYSEEI